MKVQNDDQTDVHSNSCDSRDFLKLGPEACEFGKKAFGPPKKGKFDAVCIKELDQHFKLKPMDIRN